MTSRNLRKLRQQNSAAGLLAEIADDRWAIAPYADAARWSPSHEGRCDYCERDIGAGHEC